MKKNVIALCIFACHNFVPQTLANQQQIDPTDPALQIVNKKTSIGRFEPDDLVTLDYPNLAHFKDLQVSKRIVADLIQLINAAKNDGLKLKVRSAYRSYDEQVATFDEWVKITMKRHPKLSRSQAEAQTNRFSARPGHSEHQLGTTIDIVSSENGYNFSSKKLKYIAWIAKNAKRFHFKVSWPKGNPEFMYEPWHIRWYPH